MNKHLYPLGWTETLQYSFESTESPSLIPARVIRENRGQYIVSTGADTITAQISGAFHARALDPQDLPTVGDWAVLNLDSSRDHGVIKSLLPRKTLIERQAAGNQSRNQLIAANVDTLFLVSGLDAEFNINRIQRYLTLIGNSGARPVILLNKSDARPDPTSAIRAVEAIAPDAPIHAISAISPAGLAPIQTYIQPGRTIALLGSSGVGKSTLVNALIGEAKLPTQSNRDADSKGRHTTTWRELIRLPQGGMIIDLPGMREIQLTGDMQGHSRSFAEVETLAKRCRFRNCSHQNEPGCAIAAALENGELDPARLDQYQKLKHESETARARSSERRKNKERQQNPRLEKERSFKEISKKLRKRKNAQAKWNRKNGGF